MDRALLRRPRADAPVLAAIGLAAAWLARSAPLAALLGLAAGLATALAALRPGLWLGLLLGLVLLQDLLVARGLARLQVADEVMVLAGLGGLALRALWSWRRGGALPRTPLDLPSLALVLAGLAGAWWNAVPPLVAALGLLALLKGLLAFQLGARTPLAGAAIRRGTDWLLGLAALLAGVGLAQRLGGEAVYGWTGQAAHYARWLGTKTPALFDHHNAFGHAMVFGGALALGLAWAHAPRVPRLALLAAPLCLAGLVVSASRESWLAAVLALAAAALAARSRRLALLALVATLVLAAGAAFVYLGSPFLREELARRTAGVGAGWHDYRLGFTGQQFRGEYRVYVLLKSWEVFADHPWLGTGPGRFGGAVAARFPSPVYEAYDFLALDGVLGPLDVFWAGLLAELGLLGALAFLWAFGAALSVHLRALGATEPLTRGLGLGGVMAWVAVLVFGAFAPALEDPLVAIPFWLWAGLVWRMGRPASRDGEGLPDPGLAREGPGAPAT